MSRPSQPKNGVFEIDSYLFVQESEAIRPSCYSTQACWKESSQAEAELSWQAEEVISRLSGGHCLFVLFVVIPSGICFQFIKLFFHKLFFVRNLASSLKSQLKRRVVGKASGQACDRLWWSRLDSGVR
jgi:hypothetical protein